MILGKVIGNLHSTINHPFYDGKKLLLVRAEKPDDGKPAAEGVVLREPTVVAVDKYTGQMLKTGQEAQKMLLPPPPPAPPCTAEHGGFLSRLLPRSIDTGDLLMLLILLLLVVDGEEEDQLSVILTAAAFLLS